MIKILVTDKPSKIPLRLHDVRVCSAIEYLMDFEGEKNETCRVFNLCQSYKYQSRGYYVSLLAEARGHRPIPSVKTLVDIQNVSILNLSSPQLDAMVNKALRQLKSSEFELSIYFGKNMSAQYDKLCGEIYRHFRAPLLRVFLKKQPQGWEIRRVKILSLNDIPETHLPFLQATAHTYFSKQHKNQHMRKALPFTLAILVNPDEENPPSNPRALKNFTASAEKYGFHTEFVTKKDLPRLAEFNALFIRESTLVNHHTYLFSRRAQSEGLVVIDDPESILKCTNKVYLYELLKSLKIPTPRTLIQQKKDIKEIMKHIGLPCVVKIPDSAFSLGVKKAENAEELEAILDSFFQKSELVLVQEYTPTDFDWRVGVLNHRVLFVCKYYMAKGHWQIYNWQGCPSDQSGYTDAIPVEEAPDHVIQAALKSAKAIGRGLYGVDIKELPGNKAIVIEVNDNPSIDAGVEDFLLKHKVYDSIMSFFANEVKQQLGL
ncbi:MAG: RimK family protein [Spirochaetales bacterium]|nr:RimK family protein [Spirochaetales bacterium]